MALEERSASSATIAGLSELETSKVLRNTYMLLGITIAFSALVAFVSMSMGVGFINPWIALIGVIGLSFAVHKTADSAVGLIMVFVFTGFLGFILGPLMNYYLAVAPSAILPALVTTAVVFAGLSAMVLVSKKDFSFMRSFVHVGWMVLLASVVLVLLFDASAWHTALSAFVVLLMSATIIWQTSEIIHGGETNYIRATTTLFMSIYNLFTALLHLFAVFGGDD